ncbi:MAG: hydrolase [Alphaproteobacteria bacterium]|nr:hydrolase [Alphaproteobacteria bacterium]
MTTRQQLILDIEKFVASDKTEAGHRQAALDLLESTGDCFLRSDFPGHFVAGAWLVSPDGKRVLLNHHKFLDRWLQFGGHADGEVNLLQVALREAEEESGIADIVPVRLEIFDIDVHPIPANPKKDEPSHLHYELRYLVRAPEGNYAEDFHLGPEGNTLKWFSVQEIAAMGFEASVQRLADKWQAWLAQQKQ